jgi:hypothetical protein
MGNRAVLCLKNSRSPEYDEDAVGIYVHWNGGEESIKGFLKSTRELMGDRVGDVDYTRARLIQTVGNFFGGNLSVGVNLCRYLDTEGDNGVYVIDCTTLKITNHLE